MRDVTLSDPDFIDSTRKRVTRIREHPRLRRLRPEVNRLVKATLKTKTSPRVKMR